MTRTRSDDPPSFTALTTAMAFKNALGSAYGAFFSSEDVRLTGHFIETAIAAEPDSFMWIVEKGLDYSGYSLLLQSSIFSRSFARGYVPQKLARKLMIKTKIEHDIEQNGVEQIVFLSGGYDPRGFSIAKKYPHVNVFELDRGKTHQIKLNALLALPTTFYGEYDDMDFAINGNDNIFFSNYHLVECDFLRSDLANELKKYGFDPNKKTLFVAEGLTMYLPQEDNEKLLKSIFNLSGQDNEILLSYRSATNNQTVGGFLQSLSKEEYRFALTPKEVNKFVTKLGFSLEAKMLYQDMLNWVHSQVTDNPATTPTASPAAREHYYLLKKDPSLLEKESQPEVKIAELPLITQTLDEVNPVLMKRGSCALL